MRKSFVILGAILLFALVAAAQDAPRMETFLGYSYARFSSATNVPSFDAHGGDGQFAYNFNKWFGAVVDLGAVHTPSISGVHLDSTFANFLAGPRVTFRHSRFQPYVDVLWGGVYATTSAHVQVLPVATLPIYPPASAVVPGQPITARLAASQTAFAMVAGGGLDIKLSKHVMFRPVGAEYYLTRLQNLRSLNDNNQNNFRYTAGFNFTFGAQ